MSQRQSCIDIINKEKHCRVVGLSIFGIFRNYAIALKMESERLDKHNSGKDDNIEPISLKRLFLEIGVIGSMCD
jgi:hypothetical protein